MKRLSPPKISIVIPMFNSEKYIQACIDSILEQNFKDFEIIIVDDCSTDRSAEIVKGFKDNRIKFIQRGKNSGAGSARNLGIELSRGKYIEFIDSDDLILQDTLRMMYDAAEGSQAEVVSMNAIYETFPDSPVAKKNRFQNSQPRFLPDDISARLQQEYLVWGTRWESVLKLQRRDFLLENQIFFPIFAFAEDRLFHLAELCFAKKVQVISCCGYVYRHHSEQITRTPTDKNLKETIIAAPIAFEFIRKVFDRLQMSEEINQSLTVQTMIDYLKITFINAYQRDPRPNRLDPILREIVFTSRISEPRCMISMLKIIAEQMLENGRNRMTINSLIQSLNQKQKENADEKECPPPLQRGKVYKYLHRIYSRADFQGFRTAYYR